VKRGVLEDTPHRALRHADFGQWGRGWKLASNLAEHFNALGFAIIGLFVAAWAASYFIYRWKRFDEIEVVGETTR
jgi:nickel/cobalt transporter (NiCoT) family protein